MTNPKYKALADHLKKHGKNMSWPALSKKFAPGANNYWSRIAARDMGFNTNTNEFDTLQQIESTKQKHEVRKHVKDRDFFIKRIIQLENEVEVYRDLANYKPRIRAIEPSTSTIQSEATAIVQWSDWHLDEVVRSCMVGGLNEYNPKVAEQRCNNLFKNTIKLVNTQRHNVHIHNLVLHLGGDFIGGYLHPELEQTNSMGPMEAVEFAAEQIINGIEYLRKHGKFKNIIVVTSRGNHGRLTKKMQFANDHALNLETIVFSMVKKHFGSDKLISWHIYDAELAYLDVYGKTLRFLHGHQIRFKGGIGGMTVPLYKAIHRWNDTKKAYYTFMCDKHSYQNPTPDAQVNGSLKGYDAFAQSFGFSYQPPIQSFTLLDKKRGITIKAPIFCND